MSMSSTGQFRAPPGNVVTESTASARIRWLDRLDLEREVGKHIEKTAVVLDIGCGLRPQTFFRPKVHLCCEPHGEYAERLQAWFAREPAVVVVRSTADRFMRQLPEKSVDSVFLLDLIEHLAKEDGLDLLARCERLARRQVIVFTPFGFLPQEYDEHDVDGWGLQGARWQRHLSGWSPSDFSPDWQILACADFHTINGAGEPLSAKHGAFWAIKTRESTTNRYPKVAVVSRSLPPDDTPEARSLRLICRTYPADRLLLLSTKEYDAYGELQRKGRIDTTLDFAATMRTARLLPKNGLGYARSLTAAVAAAGCRILVAVPDGRIGFPVAYWVARRAGIPFVARLPDRVPGPGARFRHVMARVPTASAIQRADAVWAPNEEIARLYSARFPRSRIVSGPWEELLTELGCID